jgi:hypothetical protein
MLAAKQSFEGPKVICSKFWNIITIDDIDVMLTNLDSCHKSHTNISHIYANLINAIIDSNRGKMHGRPSKICKSNKCS